MVWLRLSALNFLYYNERILKVIAEAVGKPIKSDLTTTKMERGNYARVCVEVNLASPVIRKVWIQDHWHEVELESLNLICRTCSCYDHVAQDCKKKLNDHVVVQTPRVQGGSPAAIDDLPNPTDSIANLNKGDKFGVNTVTNDYKNGDWKVVENRKKKTRTNKGKGLHEDSAGLHGMRSNNVGNQLHVHHKNGEQHNGLTKNGLNKKKGPEALSSGTRFVFATGRPNGVIKGGQVMARSSLKSNKPTTPPISHSDSPPILRPRVKRVQTGSPLLRKAQEFKSFPSLQVENKSENVQECNVENLVGCAAGTSQGQLRWVVWFCSSRLYLFGFVMMNVISWNFTRAVNVAGKRVMSELVKKYLPAFFYYR